MSKLTPWFPPHIKPVRMGVYEVKEPVAAPWYRWWNGKRWLLGGSQIAAAGRNNKPTPWGATAWRGLAEAPDDASKLPKEG